jgi:hypothetical protein
MGHGRERRCLMKGQIEVSIVAVFLVVGTIASSRTGAGADTSPAAVDPTDFTSPVSNPYFPLEVGRVAILRGSEDGTRLHERVTVTTRTKTIQGVTATVVSDVQFVDGVLEERTRDWYATDDSGNVWYLGEATAEYDRHGHIVSTEGSWQAGVDGARAGIVMPSDPRPTIAYRQEFLRGEAEDQAWIVARRARATVAYGTLDHLVRSFEWSRLEPGVMDAKLYALDLGIVKEATIVGGTERLELVRVFTRT